LSKRTLAVLSALILSCGVLIGWTICFLAVSASPSLTLEDPETGYFTTPQWVNHSVLSYKCKMGIGSQYFYIGPSPDRDPRFYSAIMAKTEGKMTYIVWERVEISGIDPNGDVLPPDHFTNPTIVTNPNTVNEVEIRLFKVIFNALVEIEPTGLSAFLKCGTEELGGKISFGYDDAESIFWVEYHSGGVPEYQEKAIRVGFDLDVYPGMEGVYTINVTYKAFCYLTHGGPIFELSETLQYHYVNTPLTPQQPSGPTIVYTGESANYTAYTTDPNNDMLRYLFDWGDNTTTLTDWVYSGEVVTASHSWEKPKLYEVKVKAQDSTGAWSDWSQPLIVNDP